MTTGIEVTTKFFPLAWILYFCTPVVEINGEKNKKSWGTNFIKLKPGKYLVKIYFPYILKPECGANEVEITVSEGETKRISFYMPPWMFSKGTIEVMPS